MRRLVFFLVAISLISAPSVDLKLPMKDKSVRLAIIGDSGTGEKAQYETAGEMAKLHEAFPFDFVLMMGDNIYGSQTAVDFERKFELPYGPLLDAGIKFYACLGNHDSPNDRNYKPFNMDGKRYYSFKKGDAEFFALDSNYMDPEQLDWIRKQLGSSTATWKICFFHHPLYSAGRAHGSDVDLRKVLEPIFEEDGVSAVFSGHDHLYERTKPQNGIYYFVVGCSGELRPGNLKPSPQVAKGFDSDRAFELVEIAGDQLYFQTIARSGETVDSGTLEPRKKN